MEEDPHQANTSPTARAPRSVDKPTNRSEGLLRWISGEGRRRATLSEEFKALALHVKRA
jgi:hypothetical protein